MKNEPCIPFAWNAPWRKAEIDETKFHRIVVRPMRMKYFYAASLLLLVSGSVCGDSCDSFRDSRGRSAIDFAPLPGFVDVCSRDFQLCVLLTEGYPPSVQTLGYFVPSEEWERYQKGQHKGFSRYLIAQKGEPLSAEKFADFKRYVHSQQGDIADRRFSSRVVACRSGSLMKVPIQFRLAPY